jgi:uncharacterized protein (TIGR02145 family)
MAENLKVTHYNDGESIPNLVDGDSWRFTSSGAYCEYDNLDYDFSLCPNECYWMRISAEEYVAIYGRLYNGYAISDDRGVCPEDWHVPNEDDWNLLIDYLGDNAGHELKTTYGWYDYNGNPTNYGTNESGFSALPGGLRYNFGDPYGFGLIISSYDWITTKSIYWVSAENCTNGSCDSKILFYNNDYVMTQYAHINYGLSIRCVQDQIQEGCTDPEACNYDESAEVDDGSCAYEIDCAGTCGGDLEIDCSGVCGGDNSTALSCCGSPLYEDCTDDCVIDDLGQCCIPQDVDVCGVCFGDDTSCQQLGDINGDGTINVIDIVIAVDLILNGNYDVVADVNEDGYLDVLDIVMLVNWVLNGETTLCDGLTEVELWGQYYDIATTTSIDITYVGLTGSIPPEIGCLTNLTILNLGGNQLTGGIPSEIGNLTNLTYLILYYNQLTGSIPSEIGNLTNLTDLWLFVNQLTGEIPVEVCDLIESNNLDINAILEGNNLINTCD